MFGTDKRFGSYEDVVVGAVADGECQCGGWTATEDCTNANCSPCCCCYATRTQDVSSITEQDTAIIFAYIIPAGMECINSFQLMLCYCTRTCASTRRMLNGPRIGLLGEVSKEKDEDDHSITVYIFWHRILLLIVTPWW